MASRRYATRVQPRTAKKAGSQTLANLRRYFFRASSMVVISACVYGVFIVSEKLVDHVNTQRVERLRIEGELKRIDESYIQQVVSGYASQSFLRIDLTRLKADLEAAPWIREVAVQREWPDTLIVHITEQQAIARWNNNALLNQYGEIFIPAEVESQQALTLLEGPEGRSAEVMQQYQKFSQVLLPHGLRLSALSFSRRGAWQMQLDNGVVVNVGKTEVVERLQRFSRVLEGNLFNNFADIEYIDLRYRNGIAIQHPGGDQDTRISAL